MQIQAELEQIPSLAKALERRFGGREPFQIITRLLEECGELAQEVSHFEGSPTKLQKHGEPSTVFPEFHSHPPKNRSGVRFTPEILIFSTRIAR